jgi:hypothetical protein
MPVIPIVIEIFYVHLTADVTATLVNIRISTVARNTRHTMEMLQSGCTT